MFAEMFCIFLFNGRPFFVVVFWFDQMIHIWLAFQFTAQTMEDVQLPIPVIPIQMEFHWEYPNPVEWLMGL